MYKLKIKYLRKKSKPITSIFWYQHDQGEKSKWEMGGKIIYNNAIKH